MPQPADLVYLVNQFALFDGSNNVEIAEFGMYGGLTITPPDSGSWDAALAGTAQASIAAWAAHMDDSRFSPGVIYQQAIATRQSTAGLALNEAREVPSGTAWAGSGTQSLPWEVAVCINLYGFTRGTFTPQQGRKRGRVYLPPLATAQIGNNFSGKMGGSQVTGLLGDFSDFLTALASTPVGAPEQLWRPTILSKTGDMITSIVQLSTDDRFDSQRRRERQQPVAITSVDWTYPS